MSHEAADKAFRETYPGNWLPENAIKVWREAWQACESQMGSIPDSLSVLKRVKAQVNLFIRAAAAEMREKAALACTEMLEARYRVNKEGIAAMPNNYQHPVAAIRALPIDPDPHWLEKQLLDARIAEASSLRRRYHGMAEFDRPLFFVKLMDKEVSDLEAERRALDAKEGT